MVRQFTFNVPKKSRTPVINKLEQNNADEVIFGKNDLSNIVSIEVDDNANVTIFREKDGSVTTENIQTKFWLVSPSGLNKTYERLDGDLYYKYIKTTPNRNTWMSLRKQNPSSWSVWNAKEATMIYEGLTHFKGMNLNEVSVLSFDIESYGLLTFRHKEIYMISCTLWKNGTVTRKQFCEDELGGEKNLIIEFCKWVREVDPSVITGWNIYGYDFPYLARCAAKYDIDLELGRDGSVLKLDSRESKFRYDGSNDWVYHNCEIYGREIIDGMFLAVRYDIGRKFPSWKLKAITDHLVDEIKAKQSKGKSLNEVEQRYLDCNKDRQFYDAGTIRDKWGIPEERQKIKSYCKSDGDDALNFFHLAVPAFFYMNQKVPKPFADMINKATGSQMNSIMVRAYLQENHSLPKADPKVEYEGALSLGVPGVYRNNFKVDVSSLYPSIMIQWNVFSEKKDPKQYFPLITSYLTKERLHHKKVANEKGTKYNRDMEQSLKIGINSLYGFLGATGLLFNYPEGAAFITEKGREILEQAINWATGKNYDYWKTEAKGA